jgi:endonuclease-3 related protein
VTQKEQKIQGFVELSQKINASGRVSDRQWMLWCKKNKSERDREEVIIGSVLTQQTNWVNVEAAIAALKGKNLCGLKEIAALDEKKLAEAVKPAGYYCAKSRCLKKLAECVIKNYGGVLTMMDWDLVLLRQSLLAVKGVGFETADSILLYALDKPTFLVDEYTRRLACELWPDIAFPKKEKPVTVDKKTYLFLKNCFEEYLEKDFKLYQDFHAKIVIYGKKEGNKKRFARRVQKRKR